MAARSVLLALCLAAALNAESGTSEILQRLKNGNSRFAEEESVHPHVSAQRIKKTALAESPEAVILSCSDSRVAPELVFDQGIGDLVAVRVAGNVANNDEIASAAWAVAQFHSPLLIVLGHTSCSAVAAVVNRDPVPDDIKRLIGPIAAAVQRTSQENPALTGDELMAATVRTNVFISIEDLLRSSALLRDRVKKGELQIVGAVYDVATGRINWLGQASNQYQILEALPPESLPISKNAAHQHE